MLTEAIQSLQATLREQPSNTSARTFLFELLCFAGEFERAAKQLIVLSGDSKEATLGSQFYLAALAAEVERHAWYDSIQVLPKASTTAVTLSGICNGKFFKGILDIDARLGDSLEFLSAGRYHQVSFEKLFCLEFEPPSRARDLYWRTASLTFSSAFSWRELDSVLVPVLYPQTSLFDDDQTRLGWTTDFALSDSGQELPYGQRILKVGNNEIPLLEIHTLEFQVGVEGAGA